MNDADKEHIRWMCKTQAGGHPSWEARAEQEIATIEAAEVKPEAELAAAVAEVAPPQPAKKPTHHKK